MSYSIQFYEIISIGARGQLSATLHTSIEFHTILHTSKEHYLVLPTYIELGRII